MRLRNSFAAITGVVLLLAIGAFGILVNRSALRAADTVHRADSRALGLNNATLAGQLLLVSAAELNKVAVSEKFDLRSGDLSDKRILTDLVATSDFFKYGAALSDLSGRTLVTTRDQGLPAASDPAFGAVRQQLLAGQPGISPLMFVGDTPLTAVAVPIVVGGIPKAVLVGFSEARTSQLQVYVSRLSGPNDLISIVDSTGRIVAATDPGQIGGSVPDAVAAVLPDVPADNFVEYESGGTDMISVVVGGIPGEWRYVRTQTLASFDGAVIRRNQTTNATLLAMLVIGVAVILLLVRRAQLQRRRADQRFRALVQHAPDIVAVLDRAGRATYASPSAASLLGVPEESLPGASVFDFIHVDDQLPMRAHLDELLADPHAVMRLECRVISSDGSHRWFEFTASNQMANPALTGVVINARDVSHNRAFQDRLAYEALHDSLTGLPNRRRMLEVLTASLRDQPVAVLFADLDGFKPVNDVYGHEAGDELLRQVGARLATQIGSMDLLARVGGDEFVLLMPGVIRWTEAEYMSNRLHRVIEAPFEIGEDRVLIGISIGVHVATPADNPSHVLRAADHAMYAAKRARRDRNFRPSYPEPPSRAAEAAGSGRHRAAN